MASTIPKNLNKGRIEININPGIVLRSKTGCRCGSGLFLHPEKESEESEPFDAELISQHDDDEGKRAENEILHDNNDIPVKKEKPHRDNDTLVKDIKGQNGLTGIIQKSIPVVEISAPYAQDGKHPDPGIECPEKANPKIIETPEGRIKPRFSDPKSQEGGYRCQGHKNNPLFFYGALESRIRCQHISKEKIDQVDKNIPSSKTSLSQPRGMEQKIHQRQRKYPQQNGAGFFEK